MVDLQETRPRLGLPVRGIVARAREQIAQLTGRPATGVVRCASEGEGWRVVVETLERKAVPDTSDLLAVYAVLVDAEGEMVDFQRLRVRRRGEPVEDK